MSYDLIFVLFIYGLAFFAMGLGILIYPKKGSDFKIANELWFIGSFGILHGITEWIELFIHIEGSNIILQLVRLLIIPISFYFLFLFGMKSMEHSKVFPLLKISPAVFLLWAIIIALSSEKFLAADIFARYLIGVPAIFLTAYALNTMIPDFKQKGLEQVSWNLKIALGAFVMFGVLELLVVPKAGFFPASIMNHDVFFDYIGIPVEIFWAVTGIVIAYSMLGVLRVFDWETKQNLLRAHDLLEKKVEERTHELKESYFFLQTVIDGVGDPIMVIGDDYKLTLMNKAALKISSPSGHSLCHEISHNSHEPCREENHPCPLDEVKRTGKTIMLSHEHVGPHGETRYIEIMASPLYGPDGSISGIIKSSRDITDRRKAQEVMLKNEANLKRAEELGNMGNWEWDMLTNEITWSDEVFRIYGLDPKKDVPSYHLVVDTVSPEYKDAFVKAVEKAVADRTGLDGEYCITRPDGTQRFTYTKGEVTYDEQGRPLKMFGMVLDITERKMAEKAIRVSEEKFRDLFENSTDAIFILDMKGNFIDINRTAHERLGYTKEEMLAMHISQLDPPEFAHRVPERLATVMEKGSAVFESAHFRKDGTIMPVEINSRVLDYEDQRVYFSVVRDITDRKAAEEELKLNSEMLERSLEEKELLLREVHHRVKNNLQVISSLLRLQSGFLEDEDSKAMFKDSQDRVRSMALVHEELYHSRDFSRVDFKEYIKNLVNGLFRSYAINSAKIKYTLNIDDVVVGIDVAIPFGLIINELVSNSLKHAFPDDRDGVIEIVLRPTAGGLIELIVKDNGVGIPDGFDPTEGKTMGLQLVTTLAQNQLHGTMDIKNEGGTEFKITFKEPYGKEASS